LINTLTVFLPTMLQRALRILILPSSSQTLSRRSKVAISLTINII